MAKIMRVFCGVIAICFILESLNGTQVAMAHTPVAGVTQSVDLRSVDAKWYNDQAIPDSYIFIAENASFQLYVDENRLAFKVVDKRSG